MTGWYEMNYYFFNVHFSHIVFVTTLVSKYILSVSDKGLTRKARRTQSDL